MTKRIWAGLLALGMALTALPFGIYAEETAWEEEANASEETLDGGLDESAEEFADGLPDYIPEPEYRLPPCRTASTVTFFRLLPSPESLTP